MMAVLSCLCSQLRTCCQYKPLPRHRRRDKKTSSVNCSHNDGPYLHTGHKHQPGSPPVESAGPDPLGQAMRKRWRNTADPSSPTLFLATIPQGSSPSVASTVSTSRFNSDISALLVPPSQSSADIYSHRPPNTPPFNQGFPTVTSSATTGSADLNPHTFISPSIVEAGKYLGSHSRKIAEARKASSTKLRAVYRCRCCSNRPKISILGYQLTRTGTSVALIARGL